MTSSVSSAAAATAPWGGVRAALVLRGGEVLGGWGKMEVVGFGLHLESAGPLIHPKWGRWWQPTRKMKFKHLD